MKKPPKNNSPLNPNGLRLHGTTVYYPNGESFTFATRDAAYKAYQKAKHGQTE